MQVSKGKFLTNSGHLGLPVERTPLEAHRVLATRGVGPLCLPLLFFFKLFPHLLKLRLRDDVRPLPAVGVPKAKLWLCPDPRDGAEDGFLYEKFAFTSWEIAAHYILPIS